MANPANQSRGAPWWNLRARLSRTERPGPHYSTKEIRTFLEQDWDEERRAALEAHLARCADCRAEIERLALGKDRPSPPPADVRPADMPEGAPVDRYAIRRVVGRGGQGVVYEAVHRRMDRPVALKLLPGAAGRAARNLEGFLNEARAHAQLHHPNIVPVYDFFEWAGHPWLALEFVPGGRTLEALLDPPGDGGPSPRRGQPVPPREAAELVRDLARAIEYAHSRGIIHRDLKPANILLDGHGTPRVSDFGLAWAQGGGPLLTPARAGTARYMSPEQARDQQDRIGPRTDVYGLSAILYELLAARPPFDGGEAGEILHQVRTQPPAALPAAVPADLAAICCKGLAKEPAERYESAAALAEDLQRFLEHRPTAARRPWWPRRVRMWAGRNPATAAALGLLLLLTVVLAGASVWINDSRRAAVTAREEAEETAIRERGLRRTAANTVGDLQSLAATGGLDSRSRVELLGLVAPLLQDLKAAAGQEDAVYLELGQECSQGLVALDERRFASAEQTFRRVREHLHKLPELKRRKFRAVAEVSLVSVLSRTGQLESASGELTLLLDTAREFTPPAGAPVPSETATLYNTIPLAGLELAQAWVDKGQPKEAVRCLDKLLEAAATWLPTDFGAARQQCQLLIARAGLLFTSGRAELAIKDLDTSVRITLPWRQRDPKDRDAVTLLWRCYVRRAHYGVQLKRVQAGVDFEQARELLPHADAGAWPLEDAMLMALDFGRAPRTYPLVKALPIVQRLELAAQGGRPEYVVTLAAGYLLLATCEYRDGNKSAGDGWRDRFEHLGKTRQPGGAANRPVARAMDDLRRSFEKNVARLREEEEQIRRILLDVSSTKALGQGAQGFFNRAREVVLAAGRQESPVDRRICFHFALDMLEAAYLEGFADAKRLEDAKVMEPLRKEPRYIELVKRMKARKGQPPSK